MKLTNKKNAIKINYGKNGVWGGRVLQKKEKKCVGFICKKLFTFFAFSIQSVIGLVWGVTLISFFFIPVCVQSPLLPPLPFPLTPPLSIHDTILKKVFFYIIRGRKNFVVKRFLLPCLIMLRSMICLWAQSQPWVATTRWGRKFIVRVGSFGY